MRPTISRRQLMASLAAALATQACREAPGDEPVEVTLGAATSLRRVLPPLVDAFRKSNATLELRMSYGASGDLRKRAVDGAPFDAMLLASAKPVDDLIASGHVDAATRKVITKNDLVLIAPADSTTALTFQTIDALPEGEKLAIGEPAAVPAGDYAKQAFEKLGRWDGLKTRLVFGGDVAAVLSYVRRGEVAAAVVYGTEVIGIDEVKVLDRASGHWAPTPEVVAGVIAKAPHANDAGRFLEFLLTAEAQTIFAEYGFAAL